MVTLTFIILLAIGVANAKYYVIHKSVECKSNPEYVPKQVCEIKEGGGDEESLLTMYFEYAPGKLNNVWLHEALYRKHDDKWEVFFLNITMDVCKEMDKLKTGASKLQRPYEELLDMIDPKLKEGCPLQGPIDVKEKRGNDLIPKSLPPVFPSGEYRTISRLWIEPGNITVSEIAYYFTMDMKIPDKLKKTEAAK